MTYDMIVYDLGSWDALELGDLLTKAGIRFDMIEVDDERPEKTTFEEGKWFP